MKNTNIKENPYKKLEDIFSKREPCDKTTTAELMDMQKNSLKVFKKKLSICGVIGDLEKIGNNLHIFNAIGGKLVRKIRFTNEKVIVDPMDGSFEIEFNKDEPVYYEPWTFDRGSYLIHLASLNKLGKLATELDFVKVITTL